MKSGMRHFLTGTLRGRLIVGVALVHAVMMSVFIADLTLRQRRTLLQHQVEAARMMSGLLASSSAEWIAVDDVSGLQELIESQVSHAELRFAILADADGRVLAATDKTRVGQYLLDLPDSTGQAVVTARAGLADVATPAMVGPHVVGWARVGIGPAPGANDQALIVRDGVAYTLVAIIVGSLIAWMMGSRITARLYVIQAAINAIRGGDRGARAVVDGVDEAAMMAGEFNAMLDAASRQDAELLRSNERLRVELEERTRLATAIEQAAEMIVITDTAGTIQYVNPAFERVTGYLRSEVIGRNPRILKSDRQDPAAIRELWATLGRGEVWSGHFTNRTKDGVLFEEDAVISPVRNAEGVVTNFVAVKRDTTREMRLEEQYRQAQKMEAIGRLAGGVAHDFNNMLELIIGYADLALEDLDAAHPVRDNLIHIRRAGERSADLTRQLLAFARKQAVQPRILDLNSSIEDMLKMLRHLIGEDIGIDWRPAAAALTVRMDPSQVDQVLANLCVNARDAIAGAGTIVIETGTAAFTDEYCTLHSGCLPGRYVVVSVRDTGCGMDQETAARIFEPFFTTKEAGKGTGLGLATVYGIVTQNQGFIQVDTAPGCGTTFRLHLPRYESPVLPGPARVQAGSGRGDETVLVVEDEAAILGMLRAMLGDLGYTVLAASTPRQAIGLASEHGGRIAALVTDVVMPEMNGRELSAELAARWPGLRTLYMSGYSGNALDRHGMLEPGVQLLQKPFSKQELATALRLVLDQPAAPSHSGTNPPLPG